MSHYRNTKTQTHSDTRTGTGTPRHHPCPPNRDVMPTYGNRAAPPISQAPPYQDLIDTIENDTAIINALLHDKATRTATTPRPQSTHSTNHNVPWARDHNGDSRRTQDFEQQRNTDGRPSLTRRQRQRRRTRHKISTEDQTRIPISQQTSSLNARNRTISPPAREPPDRHPTATSRTDHRPPSLATPSTHKSWVLLPDAGESAAYILLHMYTTPNGELATSIATGSTSLPRKELEWRTYRDIDDYIDKPDTASETSSTDPSEEDQLQDRFRATTRTATLVAGPPPGLTQERSTRPNPTSAPNRRNLPIHALQTRPVALPHPHTQPNMLRDLSRYDIPTSNHAWSLTPDFLSPNSHNILQPENTPDDTLVPRDTDIETFRGSGPHAQPTPHYRLAAPAHADHCYH